MRSGRAHSDRWHAVSHGKIRNRRLPFAISLNSVSTHIRLLERAGLVRRQIRGREHVLSFNAESLDGAAEWIEEHRALWKGRLRALDALLKEEDRDRRREKKGSEATHDRIR